MSYNFGVVVRDWSQMEVGQRLDRGWTEVGQRLDRGWTEVGQRLDRGWTEVGQGRLERSPEAEN